MRKLHCFQDVYTRILEGWPLSEIARFVQDVKKEACDISRQGLISALQDFRSSIPAAELTKKRITPVYQAAAAAVEEGIDELKELDKLYRLQMGRIEIDLKNEQNIKKLLPTTGQEVRIAREILSTYADLKMDLGLSKRHLGQVEVDARVLADVAVRYQRPEVQSVINNAQSRKKVLGLAERLLAMGSARVATVVDAVQTPVPAPVQEAEVIDVEAIAAEDAAAAEVEAAFERGTLPDPGEDEDIFAEPILEPEEAQP